jgi:hypothetical protein
MTNKGLRIRFDSLKKTPGGEYLAKLNCVDDSSGGWENIHLRIRPLVSGSDQYVRVQPDRLFHGDHGTSVVESRYLCFRESLLSLPFGGYYERAAGFYIDENLGTIKDYWISHSDTLKATGKHFDLTRYDDGIVIGYFGGSVVQPDEGLILRMSLTPNIDYIRKREPSYPGVIEDFILQTRLDSLLDKTGKDALVFQKRLDQLKEKKRLNDLKKGDEENELAMQENGTTDLIIQLHLDEFSSVLTPMGIDQRPKRVSGFSFVLSSRYTTDNGLGEGIEAEAIKRRPPKSDLICVPIIKESQIVVHVKPRDQSATLNLPLL